MNSVVSIMDVGDKIPDILSTAQDIRHRYLDLLTGYSMAILFEKPSLRTRASFEMAMRQLGGEVFYMSPQEVQIGVREPIKDVANVVSRYVDIIAYRGFQHRNTLTLATESHVPVINSLDDREHPCQALADFLTIKAEFGSTIGKKLAYIGDGNNVCNSLLLGAPYAGIDITVATPMEYRPPKDVINTAINLAERYDTAVTITDSPKEAVYDADAVYTDTWISMGSEEQRKERLDAFEGFQVTVKLMLRASENAIFMHCLPAHRGEEVMRDVIDGQWSRVYQQAENRLHAQKSLILHILGTED